MVMKKARFVIVTFVLAAILVACGAKEPSASNSEEKYTIVFGTPQTVNSHAHRNVYEPWVDFVEKTTNGKVSVELHPGSALGNIDTALEDIRNGVYDAGYITIPQYLDTAFFPYSIIMLPFAFPDAVVSQKVAERFAEKYHQEEAFDGIYSLGIHTSDPYILFSTKPVTSIEDLQGLKIQVPSKSVVEVVKAWGATPVTMPPSDIYQGLERNTIDATIYGGAGGEGFKFHEVAPYVVDLGAMSAANFLAMNRATYESFSNDVKGKFDGEISTFMPNAFVQSYLKELDRVHAIYEKGHNGVGGFTTLSPEEKEKFMASAEEVWNAWVTEANERGYDGDQMMADFKEMLAEEGIHVPF